MSLTRRAALFATLAAAAPAFARGGASVDVSPLRAQGDNTDADHFARVLPGYLEQSLPGRNVRARIDSVTYGSPGSSAGSHSSNAVDWIEGVGFVDGREIPVTCSLIVQTGPVDVTGYLAYQRQDDLARAFAQWLPRQAGL